jgi:hypothetical protein
MNNVEKTIRTMIIEKGISTEHTFEIKSESVFGGHFVPMEVLIEFISSLDKPTQEQILKTLIMIDFKNGNILHFLEYITKGMVQLQFSDTL